MSVDRFLSCKGQFVTVNFTTTKTPAAKHKGVSLVKIVEGTFRAGVDFAKMKATEEGIAAGTRGPVQGLSYGDWLAFPYVIIHREKGQLYYRLYPTVPTKVNPTPVKATYTVDGKEVDRNTFKSYLTPSAAREMDNDKIPPCINVKAENCEFPE